MRLQRNFVLEADELGRQPQAFGKAVSVLPAVRHLWWESFSSS